MSQVLGIDYGTVRVGLALGNTEAKIASPLVTLSNDPSLATKLIEIIRREGIGRVVVGLPRGLDGQVTPQTELTQSWIDQITPVLNIHVVTVDEAGTSSVAEERLRAAGRGEIKKDQIDREAAAIILQDYLDGV